MPGFRIPFNFGCHQGPVPVDLFPEGAESTAETARNHRYSFEVLEPLQQGTLLLYAFKATRPSPEIDEITIHSGQDEIYRPGKNRWKPIEISFYEKLSGQANLIFQNLINTAASQIYEWWGGTNNGFPGGVVHLDTSSIGVGYQKPCQLALLDGLGRSVWSYYMSDCWPVKVTPSNLDYSDSDIATVTVTLRYNKAVEFN